MCDYIKTKIVCTLGPATDDDQTLEAMILAGMNVARLNFSHGNYEDHKRRADKVKAISKRLGIPVALLLDTKGPDMRVGRFAEGKTVVKAGDSFVFTTLPWEGDSEKAQILYDKLPQKVGVGNTIMVDDGLVQMVVTDVNKTDVVCRVVVGGTISNNKSVNVPSVKLDIPFLRENDVNDLLFGIENDFDFVAASFTRNASDILSIKKILEDNGSDMRIIAKIENFEGIENIDEIIKVSDGIMVARGDMGVEIPFEEIPALQKMIVKKAMVSGKPAITATQMLESMIQNPRPTRAEITDVANAIYDGTSAIMLSGETAVGKYPVEAVSTMARIAKKTEDDINYIERFSENDYNANVNITTAISHATCSAAHDLGAAAIITLTISGTTARMMSKYRPACPIIGCTSREKTMRFMCLSWGVIPVFLENMEDSGELFERAVDVALEKGYVKSGEMVVISAGLPLGIQGTTNILKVEIAGHILIRAKGSGQRPVSAPVCVCKTAKEAAKKFNNGDILVIHDTSNDLLPIIKRASGLVIESASSASHGVIVGMTLDIPVIYAANNATDILKCGAIATLDPSGGVVYSGTVKVGQ